MLIPRKFIKVTRVSENKMIEYLWVLFALMSVMGKTAYFSIQKVLLDGTDSAVELGYIASLYGFVLIAPLGFFSVYNSPPDVSMDVYIIIVGLGILEVLGLWMYLKALSLSDISIVSPMKKMKPMFVALLEPVVLGVSFVPLLIAAAASAGLGGYIVLIDKRNLLAPFKRVTEPGPLLALGTALVYTVLSLGSRFGTTRISPYFYGVLIYGVMGIGFWLLLKRRGNVPRIKEILSKKYAVIGFLAAFRSITVWIAFSLAAATMVTMVVQLTVITDVLVGGALLKEEDLKTRMAGAVMIFVGVIIAVIL